MSAYKVLDFRSSLISLIALSTIHVYFLSLLLILTTLSLLIKINEKEEKYNWTFDDEVGRRYNFILRLIFGSTIQTSFSFFLIRIILWLHVMAQVFKHINITQHLIKFYIILLKFFFWRK